MNDFETLHWKNVGSVMNKFNGNIWKLKLRIIVGMVCVCALLSVTKDSWSQTAPSVVPPSVPALKSLDLIPASAEPKPQEPLQLPANQVPLPSGSESDKDPRLKGIFDRIKLLNKIIEEDKNTPEPETKSSEPTPSELIFGNPEKPAVAPSTNPTAKPAVAPDVETSPAALPEITGGSQVLAEPMNSLELGNSLYMTANYPAAIRSYSMLLKQDMDNQEAAWLRLMLGCCYRYQDDYINAESIFRNVADRRGAGDFLMKHTTWNLQYLEGRRKRRDEFLAVETELDALLLEINNEPTQK